MRIAGRSPTHRMAWLAVAGCAALVSSAARADDWPTPGLDAAHGRLSAEISGGGFSDGRWSFAPTSGARAVASPVVADGFAVIAYLDGGLVGLRADSGAATWQTAAGAPVQGTPAIAHGRVYVPTLGDKVVAFGLADGAKLWSVDLGGMTFSSPAVVDADLIVAAGFPQRRLVRLDGATGAVEWQTAPVIEQFSNTAPAVSGGVVVVGSNGGIYYAFDAATGASLWSYHADGIVHMAAPLIVGGRVYMAGGDSSDNMHAVDLATGAPIAGWPIALPVTSPDIAGTPIDHHRVVSSFASAAGLIILETRLDDALDTDADGVADQFLSRETALAIDPTSGGVVWQRPLGRAVFGDPNAVPKLFLCPTPAAFATAGGTPFVAMASSLAGTVTVFGAMGGNDVGDLSVAGRALASPVVANGRLITVAENGTVEAQLSSVNHPPAAPILASAPHPLDAADVTLRWMAALDPDGETPSYELRVDTDGEVLQSFAQRSFPSAGATSAAIAGPLSPGVTYTWAVRARDGHGAYSSWSAPETFTVEPSGQVTVDGAAAANLRAAVAAAQPGSVIALGAGTFALAETLHVGPGVTLAGAGAGRTILDGSGLPVAVSFGAGGGSHGTGIDRATITGADTCVSVDASATGISLTHLVVRGCTTAAISVAAGGGAAIVNATVVGNGTGVSAAGGSSIKNSIVTGNAVALAAVGTGALISSFDDLFGNQSDYQGLSAGTGDLAKPVAFADAVNHDYRLPSPQPSTDKGDPADAVGDEPAPNGARINLGAFGGTADAETSAVSTLVGAAGASGTPTPTTTPVAKTLDDAAGCAVSGSPSGRAMPLVMFMAIGACLRRRRRPR
jgi:outer membrane protein assembly factor BamB